MLYFKKKKKSELIVLLSTSQLHDAFCQKLGLLRFTNYFMSFGLIYNPLKNSPVKQDSFSCVERIIFPLCSLKIWFKEAGATSVLWHDKQFGSQSWFNMDSIVRDIVRYCVYLNRCCRCISGSKLAHWVCFLSLSV